MADSGVDSLAINRRRIEKYAKVVITPAQLQNLNTTPQILVPAPTGEKALVFEKLIAVKPAGVAYAGIAANEDLAVKYTDGSGAQVNVSMETTGFLDQTTIQRRASLADQAVQSITKHAALVLQLLNGNITTGDQPLICHVFYAEVDELDSANVSF